MKKLLITALCLITLSLSAQKTRPERVISFVDVTWKTDKYESLEKQWKKLVDKDKKDAEAWENYYLAAMYKFKTSHYYKGETPKGSIEEQHQIMEAMGKSIPNTYEYNKLMYRDHNLNPEYGHYLEKAFEIDPSRIDLYPTLTSYYEVIRDTAKKAAIYRKWYSTDKEYEEYKLSYGYNALMTVEKDAIILSHGDNQVYPVEMIQFGKNMRLDVSIISQSMFLAKAYYKNLLKSLNMPAFEITFDDFKKDFPNNNQKAYNAFVNAKIQHIIDHANGRPIYFPIQIRKEIKEHFEDNLYLVGVFYKYSETPFDNYAILKKNFEQVLYLDNLKVDLKPTLKNSTKYQLQILYLVPLSELYKHYLLSGSIGKAYNTKDLILKIADDYGIKDKYLEYLNQLEEKLNG